MYSQPLVRLSFPGSTCNSHRKGKGRLASARTYIYKFNISRDNPASDVSQRSKIFDDILVTE